MPGVGGNSIIQGQWLIYPPDISILGAGRYILVLPPSTILLLEVLYLPKGHQTTALPAYMSHTEDSHSAVGQLPSR